MNPNTPPPSDDDLPDEQELRALYARLPKVEPDASLDAAVLAQATRATPVRRRPRWPVAFGSAAVLVLAVGVAWQVRDTSPLTVRPEAAPAAPTRAARAVEQAKASPTATDAGVAGTLTEPAKPSMKASAMAPAPRRAVHSARVATEAPVSSFAPVATPAPAPAPPPAEAEMAPVPAPAPAPPAPPAPAAPAEPAPANAFHYTDGNPSAPISEGLIAPGPKPASGEARKVDAAQQAKVEAIFRELDAAKSPARPSSADLPPDDRVGEIRRLLNQGQRDEAVRQLRDFRRRYPHYDLPQDLRDLNP